MSSSLLFRLGRASTVFGQHLARFQNSQGVVKSLPAFQHAKRRWSNQFFTLHGQAENKVLIPWRHFSITTSVLKNNKSDKDSEENDNSEKEKNLEDNNVNKDKDNDKKIIAETSQDKLNEANQESKKPYNIFDEVDDDDDIEEDELYKDLSELGAYIQDNRPTKVEDVPKHESNTITGTFDRFGRLSIPTNVTSAVLLPYSKPPFPSFFFSRIYTDPIVIAELLAIKKSDAPYVALFCGKTEKDRIKEKVHSTEDVYKVGALCSVAKIQAVGHSIHASFLAHKRIEMTGVESVGTLLKVKLKDVIAEEADLNDVMLQASQKALNESVQQFASKYDLPQLASDAKSDPGLIADFVATVADGNVPGSQAVLEETNIRERLDLALKVIRRELVVVRIQEEIQKEIEDDFAKHQRTFVLKEQLKKITKELGLEKKDDKEALKEKFLARIKELDADDVVHEAIKEEMNKFAFMDAHSSEFGVTRNYLDWLTTLPWRKATVDTYDIPTAKEILDEDHYELQDVKDRILEFMAVSHLKNSTQGKILCFTGPPGVGKTSIAKSIARALGREYCRFSVGGMTDTAEINGHRRTYVGALPGRIIRGLKNSKANNPLILIDEIDKIGTGVRGDPASALLEVLDPEQNDTFLDNYLDVPVDLSKVLFICTANVTDTIPGPLLDRMEVIRLSGYVLEEKVQIAKRYLIPQAQEQTGTKDKGPGLTDEAITKLCRYYCRENGVRNLQKHIEKIQRKIAIKVVSDTCPAVDIDADHLTDYLGKPRFSSSKFYEVTPVGVVMGLAWTSMGGSTLYVESIVSSTESNSKPALKYTGRLGETMAESAQLSYTLAKNFLRQIQPENDFFEKKVVHMHCPEGAVSKDGPSAGCTFTCSLLSLALQTPLNQNISMTGEISLTGKVLPVGGIKEKVIAAKDSDITTIILPEANRPDVEELPEYIKKGLSFNFAKEYKDVFDIAFPELE